MTQNKSPKTSRPLLRTYLIMMGLIVMLGGWFRLLHVNWDENSHLHPDERFLTMANMAMSLPSSIHDYLDPSISTLNPYNVGNDFFCLRDLPHLT